MPADKTGCDCHGEEAVTLDPPSLHTTPGPTQVAGQRPNTSYPCQRLANPVKEIPPSNSYSKEYLRKASYSNKATTLIIGVTIEDRS